MFGIFKKHQKDIWSYEIRPGELVNYVKLNSVPDLLNRVESESDNLERFGQTDQIVVVKINQDGVVDYAQKIDLPLKVEVDELMNSFYEKKRVPFDHSLIADKTKDEEKDDVMAKDQTEEQVEPTTPKRVIVFPKRDQESNFDPFNQQHTKAQATPSKTEEVTETAQPTATTKPVDNNTLQALSRRLDEAEKLIKKQAKLLEQGNLTEKQVAETDDPEDAVHGAVVQTLKQQAEHLKVQMEMADHSDQIKAATKSEFERQLAVDLQEAEKQNAAETAQKIADENERHEKALQAIQQEQEKVLAKQKAALPVENERDRASTERKRLAENQAEINELKQTHDAVIKKMAKIKKLFEEA